MYRGGRGGSRGGGWSGNNDNWAQDDHGGGGPSQRYNFGPSQYQDNPQYNQGGWRGGGGGRGSEMDNDGAGGSRRFRPPPHLRGRAIDVDVGYGERPCERRIEDFIRDSDDPYRMFRTRIDDYTSRYNLYCAKDTFRHPNNNTLPSSDPIIIPSQQYRFDTDFQLRSNMGYSFDDKNMNNFETERNCGGLRGSVAVRDYLQDSVYGTSDRQEWNCREMYDRAEQLYAGGSQSGGRDTIVREQLHDGDPEGFYRNRVDQQTGERKREGSVWKRIELRSVNERHSNDAVNSIYGEPSSTRTRGAPPNVPPIVPAFDQRHGVGPFRNYAVDSDTYLSDNEQIMDDLYSDDSEDGEDEEDYSSFFREPVSDQPTNTDNPVKTKKVKPVKGFIVGVPLSTKVRDIWFSMKALGFVVVKVRRIQAADAFQVNVVRGPGVAVKLYDIKELLGHSVRVFAGFHNKLFHKRMKRFHKLMDSARFKLLHPAGRKFHKDKGKIRPRKRRLRKGNN